MAMLRALVTFAFLIVSLTGVSAQQARDLPQHIGDDVFVCGKVAAIRQETKSPLRLDLDRPAPNQVVTVVIEKPADFGDEFASRALLGRICVQGRLERSSGALQIKVKSLEAIRSDEVAVPRPAGFGVGIPDLVADLRITNPHPVGQLPIVPYSAQAKRAKCQGDVEIEAVLRADGSVGAARVSRSIDRFWGLDEAALAAVGKLQFEPATLDTRPVDVMTRFLVEFWPIASGERWVGQVKVLERLALTAEPPGLVKESEVTGLEPLQTPSPKYTASAMRRKIQGQVLLDAVVRRDGTVRVLRVIKSLDPFGLDGEAIRTAEKWTFSPGRKDGMPVDTRVSMVMEFRLH